MIFLLLSSVFIYWEFLFGDYYLAFNDVGSDTWQQYVMHYHTVVNHLRAGDFSFWDFNNGFGVSQFQLNLFDPSLMCLYGLGVLFGSEHMASFLVYIQILRILGAGILCYLFLSSFSFSERAKVFAAYVYGLNGFLMVWGQHYQFGMTMIYLPLILMMVEKTLQKGKIRPGLPVAVFLAVIHSTYFSYMTCLMAGIYLIFRVLLLEDETWKVRLTKFGKTCAGMLLGVGMGLLILMPAAYIIFGVTSRMESSDSLLDRLLKGFQALPRDYYKTLFYRFFSANLQNKNGDYAGYANYYEAPSVFFSVFFVIFAVQYLLKLFRMKISVYRKTVLYSAAALSLFALALPFVGIVFNGFSAHFSRYTFILMPMFALLLAWMMNYFQEGGKICIIGLLGTLAVSVYVYRMGYHVANDNGQKLLILAMALVAVLAFLCMAAWKYVKHPKVRKYIFPVLFLLAVADMSLEGRGTVTGRDAVKKDGTTYLSELYDQDVADALAYLSENDEEFYRVEKTYAENTSYMSALAQGYHPLSTYNSMQNGNIQQFVNLCMPGLVWPDKNHYQFSQISNNGELAAFLGTRYLLSKGTAPEEYEFVRSFGSVSLYKCKEETSLGTFFGSGSAVTEENFREQVKNALNEEQIQEVLENSLALEDPVDTEGETGILAKAVIWENGNDSNLVGSVEAPTEGYVLFTIPCEAGWELQVDGKEQELLRADLGFLAVQVSEGSHELELTYHPPLLKEGILLSSICWVIYLIWLLMRRRKGVRYHD